MDDFTFDCWKPVLRDTTEEPSKGILLKDLVTDPRISSVEVTQSSNGEIQLIILGNIWGDKFRLEFFHVGDDRKLLAHANPGNNHIFCSTDTMVVLTASVVAGTVAVVATGGAALPAVAAGVQLGTTVGGAGAVASAASGAASGAAMTATAAGVLSGPVGWAVLGSELKGDTIDGTTTYDCWKRVMREASEEPSQGMLLRDVATDPRISGMHCLPDNGDVQQLVIENIWGENFKIEFFKVNGDERLLAHATQAY
ncbi:unnamed protein product [Notodromas monacha]|uniref:Uncharacterized protein n=1 Tax=Notodromas monacha TaxID=399045 RepID=A0A7R9BY69_9CRUS|nr:unnamed protein product [Notodromas monacha]CAG0922800.1 unnamed protein product [Notodromas monacha]